jgi:hypothetical protein
VPPTSTLPRTLRSMLFRIGFSFLTFRRDAEVAVSASVLGIFCAMVCTL